MKPYAIDLRERVVSAIEQGDGSFSKVAQRFCVSKNCVARWVTQKRTQGHVVPRQQGGSVSAVMEHQDQWMASFEQQTDATLAEACELRFDETGLWASQSTMCRTFQRLDLPRQKNTPCQPSDERTSTALERRVLGPSEGARPQGLSVAR